MKLKRAHSQATDVEWQCTREARESTALRRQEARSPRCAGFTLAEVLAALVFMAIVIPAAVQGLQIASLAGQVAERKSAAARLADRLLNETMISSQTKIPNQNGSIQEGPYLYRWQVRNDPWQLDSIHLITMQVNFEVQGKDYDVRLSTLIDTTQL